MLNFRVKVDHIEEKIHDEFHQEFIRFINFSNTCHTNLEEDVGEEEELDCTEVDATSNQAVERDHDVINLSVLPMGSPSREPQSDQHEICQFCGQECHKKSIRAHEKSKKCATQRM